MMNANQPSSSGYSHGVPLALSHALSQIQGVSVNSFNIAPTSGQSSVPAGGQIRIQCPTNVFLDVLSSRLCFSVSTAGTTPRLPAGVKTLFERVQVSCGGITLYNGNNFFNVQEYAMSVASNKPYDNITEHGDMVVKTDVMGAQITAESYSTNLASGTGTLFSIDLGEFSKISPRILDLSLMPQLEIVFYVANNGVMSAPKGTAQTGAGSNDYTDVASSLDQTFSIINPVFVANCYSLSDGMYSLALAQKISDVGFLEVCFPQTLAFSQAWNGSARFSLGAMSLNKLSATWRKNTFNTRGAPVSIFGTPSKTLAGATPGLAGQGGEFLAEAGQSRFQSKFQQLQCPVADGGANGVFGGTTTSPVNLQWSVNSSNLPQFQANQSQWHDLTCWANNVDEIDAKSLPEYLFNKFVISYPLALPTYPWQKATISGLDTRASNSYIELKGTNTDTTNYDCLILAETTSILRVGAGKAIEILN